MDESWQLIYGRVQDLLCEEDGWGEAYVFRIGSYNNSVSSHFALPYDPDTLAMICLSTPRMFEDSFRKWIVTQKMHDENLNDLAKRISDPIQTFMVEKFDSLKNEFSDYDPVVIHDFELLPNRRPKVLMCTCGHIAGAAYYYRPDVFEGDDENCYCNDDIIKCRRPSQKRIGLSLHPNYGGHFAFRAIVIFPTVKLPPEFIEKQPKRILNDDKSVLRAIDLFNYHWRDGRFRDCGNPVEQYSQRQLDYFSKAPADRWPVIADWFMQA